MKTRPTLVTYLIVVLLSSSSAAYGQQETLQREQSTIAPLGNKDVLEMLKMGLSPEVVAAKIKSANCSFDTSVMALKNLKAAAVPDPVLLAMVQAPAAQNAAKPTSSTELRDFVPLLHRVQFDFAPESLEELMELKLALRLKTKADVIRYAMQVLQWMVEQAKSGNRVLVEKNGALQEVLFPFLPPVESHEETDKYLAEKAEEGREYARRKARELRERAEELLERGKEVAARQTKDSISAAVEAGREAYQREKAKEP